MRLLFFVFLLSLPSFASQEVYTFIQKVRGEQNKITWTLKAEGEYLTIAGVDQESTTTITGTPSYSFNSFSYSSPIASYQMDLAGGILSVKGTTESGNRKTKTYNIGKEPWVQQFWFGLLPFLQSTEKTFRFSIVNPKNFDRVRMIAYKERIEPLTLDGKDRAALRVKVTLQGFQSMFWSGHVWFDPQTYTFLKYEANSGPNTPLMTVTQKL